jgi:hypothetical protein
VIITTTDEIIASRVCVGARPSPLSPTRLGVWGADGVK